MLSLLLASLILIDGVIVLLLLIAVLDFVEVVNRPIGPMEPSGRG